MAEHVEHGTMQNRRNMPLRLRAGEPMAEYLRRVHAAERDRHFADPFSLPTKLYRASEVAHHFDLTRQTVHNYATIGLIRERRRTPGGQRLFDESVFRRLHRIRQMKDRYRLHEIRRLLEAEDAAAVAATAPAGAIAHDPDTAAARATREAALPAGQAGRATRAAEAHTRRPTVAPEDDPHRER